MTKYIAAIDQGTTSTRCMIFNHRGEVIGSHQLEHAQIYPNPGWVEHDPLEIWDRTQDVIRGAMQKAGLVASDLAAMGITNPDKDAILAGALKDPSCGGNPVEMTEANTRALIDEVFG